MTTLNIYPQGISIEKAFNLLVTYTEFEATVNEEDDKLELDVMCGGDVECLSEQVESFFTSVRVDVILTISNN